jgi:hypothetical protein
MKKRLLLGSAVLCLLFSTAFLPNPVTEKETSSQTKFDLNDWIIDKPSFERMYEYYNTCQGRECRSFKKTKRNTAVREELEKMYTILDEEQFMGRYTDADESRYRKARGLSADDEKGKVKGFSTIITRYKVEPKGGSVMLMARFLYTDEFSICPPPDSPPCD